MPFVVILLVIAALIGGSSLINMGNRNPPEPEATITSPTSIPSPTPTEVIQEEKYTAPTDDPDPIVDCNFKYVGTKKIRSSECSKSFECQIGGQWYIYTSKEQCSQDQARSTTTTQPREKVVIIQNNDPKIPCPGYKGKIDYMPQSECPAWQDLGRRLEEAEKNFYTCVNNVESDTTKCLQAILEASRTDIPGCIYCTEEERKTASDKCGEYQKYNTDLCYQTFKTTTDLLKNQ